MRRALIMTAVALGFGFHYCQGRIILNLSSSMPQGVYRLVDKEAGRGDIVGACVPDDFARLALERAYLPEGSCKNGTRPVMKFIAGVPGDIVRVERASTSINGESLPNTRVLRLDPSGRIIPSSLGKLKLKPGEYWLLSNQTPGSLDSRYFGPTSKVLSVAKPLLVFSGGNNEKP